jgi:hypothetical protein
MAIKGKSKSRGGRRVVAAPPRPTLVVRKPPIWKRRWVWATLAGVAAAVVLFGVLLKLHHSHQHAFRQKEIEAVQSFSQALERRLPPDRQVIPPDLIQLFPNLQTDLQNLGSGQLKDPTSAVDAGQKVATAATNSSNAISSMSLTKFFPLDFQVTGTSGVTGKGATLAAMQDAQFLISQSLKVYGEAGQIMKQAAEATGTERQALAQQGQDLLSSASTLFDKGLQKLLDLRRALGFKTINPGSGVQPGQPLPTAPPSPAPTPSASASPAPSASPSA